LCYLGSTLKRIGVYGGTFDPIHYGHLILARDALDQLPLDQVVFVPAAQSPHKLEQSPTPAPFRVNMLRRAIEGEPRFRVDEIEVNRPPPSFTIDTITELRRRDDQLEIFYLIGSDNLPTLGTWHRIEELRALVHFVVLARGVAPGSAYLTIRRQIEISATEIRNRVATGRSIQYLVPPAVEEIIRQGQLYQEPTR
jgi:nicotinate-nucleotide adenylyltransferase